MFFLLDAIVRALVGKDPLSEEENGWVPFNAESLEQLWVTVSVDLGDVDPGVLLCRGEERERERERMVACDFLSRTTGMTQEMQRGCIVE